MAQRVKGDAWTIVNRISDDDIQSDQGVSFILEAFEKHYMKAKVEQAFARFQKVVFGRREASMTIPAFIHSFKNNLAELESIHTLCVASTVFNGPDYDSPSESSLQRDGTGHGPVGK